MNAANVSQIGAAKIILIVWYKCPIIQIPGPSRRPAPAPHTVFLCSKNVISWVDGGARYTSVVSSGRTVHQSCEAGTGLQSEQVDDNVYFFNFMWMHHFKCFVSSSPYFIIMKPFKSIARLVHWQVIKLRFEWLKVEMHKINIKGIGW